MKVVYIVDYPINGNSGKHKATREKAKAIGQIVSMDQFVFISDIERKTLLWKLFGKLSFDITTAFHLLRIQDFIVVQRVFLLPITRCILALRGVKVISEYHADLAEEIPLLNKPGYQKALLRLGVPFYNMNFKISDGIIYNHPYLKNRLDLKFRNPSIYSYNGSNCNEYYPVDSLSARDKLQIPPERTVFLFLGSVSQWHGVDYLIDIFNEPILRTKSDIWLYVVGATHNHYTIKLLSKISSNQIKFIPPVDTKRANLYINASNFCMLPVKQIRTSPGSPIKLYDYIACGKPVITQKDLAGYSDEVENYRLGYTLDFANSRKSAEIILSIIKQYTPDTERFFSRNNRAIAINEVSWSKRMERWYQFIQRIYQS